MRRKDFMKWAVYAVILLIAAVIQDTPHGLPSIWGALPVLVIPCVIPIAMFEGDSAGAAYAIAGGLLWDLQAGRTFGFNALFMMVLCLAVGLLIQNLFRNTFVSSLLFCFAACFILETITWFFFSYIAGNEQYLVALLRVILPVSGYSTLFVIPFYFLTKKIHKLFLGPTTETQ
jgi:rod shape-determining protein MreD